jgi:hypothetical protein
LLTQKETQIGKGLQVISLLADVQSIAFCVYREEQCSMLKQQGRDLLLYKTSACYFAISIRILPDVLMRQKPNIYKYLYTQNSTYWGFISCVTQQKNS